MTTFTEDLNSFIAKRSKLEHLVSDYSKNVNFFKSMVLNDSINDTSVLEFAKISNFLISEYEFLYNGKIQTNSRQKMQQSELVYYDLIIAELDLLDTKYNSGKLDHQDCLLKMIGTTLDSLVIDIKNTIDGFKTHFNSDAARVNYRITNSRNELGNFYAISVDFGSKHIALDLSAPAFNLNDALLRHPWVVIKRKKSASTGNEKKRKKLSFAVNQSIPTTLVEVQSPSMSLVDQPRPQLKAQCLPSSVKVQSPPPSLVAQSPTFSFVDQSIPPSDMKVKRTRKVETEKIKKIIKDYNFLHHDILVESSFRENEEKLSHHVAELFRLEQINEENRRSFFINVLSLCGQMKCNFQDLFILLERIVLKIKDFEVQNLRSQEFFLSRNKTQRESMIDRLQRKARRFVGTYGRMIFEFLEAYKSCPSEYEQTILLRSLWPLSSLTDDNKSKIVLHMSEIVSSLSAEDSLLVELSVEGFQSFRADLYSAIQAENVLQMYSAGEQDKCIELILKKIDTKSTACFSKVSFKEQLWRLIGEYYNSQLPKVGSTREIPWELRNRPDKSKYIEAALKQKRKRSSRKPKIQSSTNNLKGGEDDDGGVLGVVDGSGKVKSDDADDDDIVGDVDLDCSDKVNSAILDVDDDVDVDSVIRLNVNDDGDKDEDANDIRYVSAGSSKVKFKSAIGLVVVDDDDEDVRNGIIPESADSVKGKVKSVIQQMDVDEDADSDDDQEVGQTKLTEQTIDIRSCKFPAVFKSVRKVTSRVDNDSDESSEDDDEDEDDFSEEDCEENNDVDHLLDELLNHFSVEEIWENAQQWPLVAVDLTNEEELDCAEKKVLQSTTFSPQPNKSVSGESHFLSPEMNFVTPDTKQV